MSKKNNEIKVSDIAAVGLGGAGIVAMPKGYRRVAGLKRVYHGTSKENAKGIKEKGLNVGYSSKGTTGLFADPNNRMLNDAKKHIYVSKDPLGKLLSKDQGALAGLSDEAKKIMKANKEFNEKHLFLKRDILKGVSKKQISEGRKNSKLLKGTMKYTDFLDDFEIDPDWNPNIRTKMNKHLSDTGNTITPKQLGERGIMPGFRSKKNLGPEVWRRGGVKLGKSEWLNYAKKYKGRVAKGVLIPGALLGGGALSLAYSIKSRMNKKKTTS